VLSDLKENLLKTGKSEGCISFDELNELLPDDIKDPGAIEKIFNFLGDNNIEIVTEEESGEKRTLSGEVWKKKKKGNSDDQDDEDNLITDSEAHEA
jgi:RNA polymerase primary sigma factor